MMITSLLPALVLSAAPAFAAAPGGRDAIKLEAERPDGWITGKIRIDFAFRKGLESLEPEVETRGGVVTLRGEAESRAQRDLAEESAAAVEGVKAVDNRLTLRSPRGAEKRPREK